MRKKMKYAFVLESVAGNIIRLEVSETVALLYAIYVLCSIWFFQKNILSNVHLFFLCIGILNIY